MTEKGPLVFEFAVGGEKELQDAIKKVAESLKSMEGELAKTKKLTDDLTSAQGKSANASSALSASNKALKAGTEQAGVSVGRYKEVISQAAGAMGRMSSGGGVLVQSVSQLAGAFQVFEAGLGPVGVAIAVASAALGVFSVAMNDSKTGTDDFRGAIDDTNVSLADFITKVKDAKEQADLLAKVQKGEGSAEEQAGYTASIRSRLPRTPPRGTLRGVSGMGSFRDQARAIAGGDGDAALKADIAQMDLQAMMGAIGGQMQAQQRGGLSAEEAAAKAKKEADERAAAAREAAAAAAKSLQENEAAVRALQAEADSIRRLFAAGQMTGERFIDLLTGNDEQAQRINREYLAASRAVDRGHGLSGDRISLISPEAMFAPLLQAGEQTLETLRARAAEAERIMSTVVRNQQAASAENKAFAQMATGGLGMRKAERLVTSGPDKPTQRQQDQAAAVLKTADAYDILGDSILSVTSLTEQLAEAAINGEKITAEAVLRGAGQALKGIGEKMFGMGLAHFLAGQAEVSLGNLAAADAIAVGLTEMGIGAGLAAGGLGAMAIAGKPSSGGSSGRGSGNARPPRDNANNSGDQGSKTIVINWNQPAILAGTYADAGRLVARTLRDAGTRYGGRI